MADKTVVIISTAEVEKAYTGMMYAVNALKQKWMEEVKMIIFGPAENLLLRDSGMQNFLKQYLDQMGEVTACKFIAERDGTTGKIETLGVTVDFVGKMISDLVKDGYVPMVW